MIARGEAAITPHLPVIERNVNASSTPSHTAHLFSGPS
jgi:hypothetical protein